MLSDLRLTLRTLRKSPSFVTIAVLTLALGIGVNTAMFGIVNALLLRGLPFPEQDRLYHVSNRHLKFGGTMSVSDPDYANFRAEQDTFEGLAAYSVATFNIASPGADPERIFGVLFTLNAPGVLRVPTALGRWFRPGEEVRGAAPVVVIGYSIWQNRFKGDQAVLGQPLKINGGWATIIGVAPKDFRFPSICDAWMPLQLGLDDARDARIRDVFGRLKKGVAPEQAQADLATIANRIALAYADTSKDIGVTIRQLHDEFVEDNMRKMVVIMFGAVGLVLLIACANVANLLLARAAVRQKEIAVRTALGASRGQLMRLLLCETLVLSGAGAACGLPLAYGLMAALNAHLGTRIRPFWMVLDIDWSGVGYVLALAVFTCLVAGLWPAWRLSHTDLNSVLKDGGRGSTGFSLSKFTRAMVIGEVVLSAVLLVLSALTIRSVINAQFATLGYRTAGVFTSRFSMTSWDYAAETKRLDFLREMVRRLAARPEIENVALASRLPTQADRSRIEIEGRGRDGSKGTSTASLFASPLIVSGSYFDTLEIKVVAGRTFDERDTTKMPLVAIVSTPFAETHWPKENPLGKRFVFGDSLDVKRDAWLTVVGVVTPTQGPFQRDMIGVPQVYTPYTQAGDDTRYLTLFTRVRGAGDPALLAKVVRETLHVLDADQPVVAPQTLETVVANAWFFKGTIAWIFGIFGAVALALAAIGLYGVMSYAVSQRTQEIGVRMALGAEPRDVLALILREGGLRLGVGLALGLSVAYFAGRLLAFNLYGVEPGDPAAFGGTFAALSVTGLLACLIPALRAVRVNPVEALRHE